jgi:pantoate--beta-alanine ligase
MSSRNAYLTADERGAALVLSRALRRVADTVRDGVRRAASLRELLVATIGRERLVALDYAEIVDAATLEPVREIDGEVLVAVAAQVGRARLIDNCTLTVSGQGAVTADLGVVADPSA